MPTYVVSLYSSLTVVYIILINIVNLSILLLINF